MNVKKILLLMLTLVVTATATASDHRFTLVIDAGHGGHDSGSTGLISQEKNLALKYALAFGRMVESQCPDVRVYYTRKTDVFVTLSGRAAFANMKKADLFVSVHMNSIGGKRQARGYQTYTLGRSMRDGNSKGIDENLEVAKRENSVIFMEKDYQQTYGGLDLDSPEWDIMSEFIQDQNRASSTELAKYLQQYVVAATGRKNGGAHQNNLAVLRLTSMPACLMELGFISTPDEERYLNSDAALKAYTTGFFNAFMKYREKHDKTFTVPFKPIETTPETPQAAPEEDRVSQKAVISNAESRYEAGRKPSSADSKAVISKTGSGLKPVFKIQVLTASTKIKDGDARFKGLKGCECYEEGGIYKYTYGSSENYNEIYRLRKDIIGSFPDAFIIAFKNGRKTDVREAIKEFKNNR